MTRYAAEASLTAAQERVEELEGALFRLHAAATRMPRRTPGPGGASTQHEFRISACDVWDLDKATTEAAALLTPTPRNQQGPGIGGGVS